MAFKTAAPCDSFREHLVLNQIGNYSTTANTDADFFRETANISGMPARVGHVTDATAYGTQPTEDSWVVRLRGGQSSPAHQPGVGTNGSVT